ncbi:MAG: hypothetical protein IKK18_01685, partial [Clostridia bacterium]|nr:hypothetical protein [Clostridia bacterium]
GKLTDSDTLLSDYDEIISLSEKLNIPISMQCGLPSSLESLPEDLKKDQFPMQIYIKMPWEI